MPKFGKRSKAILALAHPDLQRIANAAIKVTDFSVICSYRGRESQNDMYDSGLSKLKYPESKHNKQPSDAIDLAPYPIDWHDLDRFYFLAGVIHAVASNLGIEIRWGGDWNRNGNFRDSNFIDLPHYELV